MVTRLAPAKVNLFLHVGAPAADGYHPLCSLMAFADVGDQVSMELGEGRLTAYGPFARGLGRESDNLIIQAVSRLVSRAMRKMITTRHCVKRYRKSLCGCALMVIEPWSLPMKTTWSIAKLRIALVLVGLVRTPIFCSPVPAASLVWDQS